jgi:hypothetical protein
MRLPFGLVTYMIAKRSVDEQKRRQGFRAAKLVRTTAGKHDRTAYIGAACPKTAPSTRSERTVLSAHGDVACNATPHLVLGR